MGLAPVRESPSARRALEAMRAYFEPTLENIGLSRKQIESQTLKELEVSLNNANDAIKHPEEFGSMQLSLQAKQGVSPFLTTNSEGQMSVGILPVLLERKCLILRRISVLRPEEQLSDLKTAVVDSVIDPKARESLLESIEKSKREAVAHVQSLQLQAEQTFQQREYAMLLGLEMTERKSAIYRSWFERESVASIMGALLLLSLGIALVIAMFTHTIVPQIITSSFLLILGYFFGQAGSTERRSSSVKRGRSRKQNLNVSN